jgi:hypothetical protein
MSKTIFLFTFLLVFIAQTLKAQDTTPDSLKLTFFESIQCDSFLLLGIESDFDALLRQKKKKKWQPATLYFQDKNGTPKNITAEIRPGGVSRQDICKWPPIKIKISPEYIATAGLRPSGNIELIVSCEEKNRFEQFVLLEYAAYKMYNILTDISLRTQLTKIRLIESNKNGKIALDPTFAFITEHPTEMAYRLGGKVVEGRKNTRPNTLEHQNFDIACLFQFMIGNTDWYPYNNHNMDFLLLPNRERYVTLIYDFDAAGFVGTPYSIPHTSLPIKDVRDRYFMGLCRDDAENQATLQYFRDKKSELLGFCQNLPYLNKSSKELSIGYLEDFFEIIENPKQTKKQILNDCDQWFKIERN